MSATVEELFGSRLARILPDAVTADSAARLRDNLGYARYALVDRGSYDYAVVDARDQLERILAPVIERVAGELQRNLAVREARVLRLGAGDYLLAHHDRVHADHPIELVLDLSDDVTPGAEVHYRRRGQVFFHVPSAPRTLAIVERGPTVTCNHTYVSKRYPAASVVRLVALLG